MDATGSSSGPRFIKIGEYGLEVTQDVIFWLCSPDEPISLAPQVVDVLRVLAEASANQEKMYLGDQDIARRANIDVTNLPKYLTILRKTLGRACIENRPRVGWRVRPQAEWWENDSGTKQSQTQAHDVQAKIQKPRITASEELHQLQRRNLISSNLMIGQVFNDGEFAGYDGIDPDLLKITMPSKIGPSVPEYVVQKRKLIERNASQEERDDNRSKVFLHKYKPGLDDRSFRVELVGAKSDWFMRLAIKENLKRLHTDLLTGRLTLSESSSRPHFSRPLDVNAVVITADNHLALGFRGDNVDYQGTTWSIFGEQVDPDKDFDRRKKRVSVAMTVRRAMTDKDELHLPVEDAKDADIRFIALATEWDQLLINLIAVATLRRATADWVKDCFAIGEHSGVAFFSFRPEVCLPLIEDNYSIEIPGAPGEYALLNDITRFAILAALYHRFKKHPILRELIDSGALAHPGYPRI